MDLTGPHGLMPSNIWVTHLPPLALAPFSPTAPCLTGSPVPLSLQGNTLAMLSEDPDPPGLYDFV